MKKFLSRSKWQILLALILILASIVMYFIHFLIFKDSHHVFIYLIGDIAFVPIEVLIVTMILHRLLEEREKKSRIRKLNMVIGVFFSEVGFDLITIMSNFDINCGEVKLLFKDIRRLDDENLKNIENGLANYSCKVESRKSDIKELKNFLLSKRDFMVRLLENPNMLEHETFTDLLWAVFHLTEELENRKITKNLPDTDMNHLSGDIKRAYGALLKEWLAYMEHLRINYPYLYSLAIRTNPFDEKASIIVE